MTIRLKRIENFNPSMKIEDIRLAEKQYLVQWLIMGDSNSAETEGGLWIPVNEEIKLMNIAKVLKRAKTGCLIAKVGEYIVFSSITGENYNHLKPQPVYRGFYDLEGLYTIHEDCVRAVIPADIHVENVEVKNGSENVDNRGNGNQECS